MLECEDKQRALDHGPCESGSRLVRRMLPAFDSISFRHGLRLAAIIGCATMASETPAMCAAWVVGSYYFKTRVVGSWYSFFSSSVISIIISLSIFLLLAFEPDPE